MAAKPLDFVELFRTFEDNDDQSDALAGLLERLEELFPNNEYVGGFTADQIAKKINASPHHDGDYDHRAVVLRGLLDVLGPRPLPAVTGHTIGRRLSIVTDNPARVGSAVLILAEAHQGRRQTPACQLRDQAESPAMIGKGANGGIGLADTPRVQVCFLRFGNSHPSRVAGGQTNPPNPPSPPLRSLDRS